MSDEQTVIDQTDTEATPSGEVSNALDDLDSSLTEFDQKATPSQPTQTPQQDDDAIVTDYVKRQMVKEQQAETDTEINSAVSLIKEGLDVHAPDLAVKGLIYAEIDKPDTLAAWQARKSNPNGWNHVLKRVRDRVKQEFKPAPDEKLTDDRDAVSAAIHSASNHTPQETEIDFASMGDREFEDWKAKNG